MNNENIPFEEELKNKKLSLEIEELKKPWYKKPSYQSIVITFLIALTTTIWTFSSGIFDLKYENLQIEKRLLEFDIRDFNSKKDSIKKVYNQTLDSLKTLKSILISKEIQLLENYKKQEALIVEKLRLQNRNEEVTKFYKNQLDSLARIVIKNKAITKALSTEKEREITTEDGNTLILE